MRRKVWEVTLDEASVQKAIDGLEDYKRELDKKCETLRKRIADEIQNSAQKGFNNAVLEDFTEETIDRTGATSKAPNVTVTVKPEGDITLVIASGKDAVWVEFGAGVTNNGPVGSTPNPLFRESGLSSPIGTYGKGYGAQEKWAITKGLWTYGTPADMPMYEAIMRVIPVVPDIAREVFGA